MALVTFSPNTKIASSDVNANFAGLADATLIAGASITASHLATSSVTTDKVSVGAITGPKLALTTSGVFMGPATTQTITGTTFTDITNATGTMSLSTNDKIFVSTFMTSYTSTTLENKYYRLIILNPDASTAFTGPPVRFFFNEVNVHHTMPTYRIGFVAGTSGSFTFKLQGRADSVSGDFKRDTNDWIEILVERF